MTKSTITREPITHDLKIYPEFFSAVCTGVKRAELRKNDRDYRVGDTLHLMETPRGSCHQTGEFINVKITHIADVGEWMPGHVLLSIEREPLHSEPVAYIFKHPSGKLFWALTDESNKGRRDVMPVYATPQPAPVVQETAHSSVIAEQLVHVLSDMKVTDHQRAVISCAVDRLNNVAQLLQLSPSALLVPEILDYQGAKELYNYLMTEEETNATVNGWNACRAAMLQAEPVTTANKLGNSPVIPDTWIPVSERMPEDEEQYYLTYSEGDGVCRSYFFDGYFADQYVTHWMALPAAPQEVKP